MLVLENLEELEEIADLLDAEVGGGNSEENLEDFGVGSGIGSGENSSLEENSEDTDKVVGGVLVFLIELEKLVEDESQELVVIGVGGVLGIGSEENLKNLFEVREGFLFREPGGGVETQLEDGLERGI